MSVHDDRDENSRVHIEGLSPGGLALFRDIAEASAKSAVEQMFVKMGLDPSQPLVSQRHFQLLRELAEHGEEDVKDRLFTRRWRGYSEGMVGKGMLGVLGLAVAGAVNAFWIGFKAAMH